MPLTKCVKSCEGFWERHIVHNGWSQMLVTGAGHRCWSQGLVTDAGHRCWSQMLVDRCGKHKGTHMRGSLMLKHTSRGMFLLQHKTRGALMLQHKFHATRQIRGSLLPKREAVHRQRMTAGILLRNSTLYTHMGRKHAHTSQ
jgi:hypothetical protein